MRVYEIGHRRDADAWVLLGMYKGGAFNFSFQINNNYPHEPPKVKCTQTVSSLWLPEGLLPPNLLPRLFLDLPP